MSLLVLSISTRTSWNNSSHNPSQQPPAAAATSAQKSNLIKHWLFEHKQVRVGFVFITLPPLRALFKSLALMSLFFVLIMLSDKNLKTDKGPLTLIWPFKAAIRASFYVSYPLNTGSLMTKEQKSRFKEKGLQGLIAGWERGSGFLATVIEIYW